MQSHFVRSINKSLLNRTTLMIIVTGFLCLIISYITRNFDMLKQFLYPDINVIEFQGLDLTAKQRQIEGIRKGLFISLFNFEYFIRSAQWIYLSIINILAVFPVIWYYDKRKTGYLKAVFMRIEHKKYLWIEGLSASVVGGIIVFIPYFIYWLLGAIFIPNDLGADMGLNEIQKYPGFNPFGFLHTVEYIKWYWLVYIIIVGVYGMCISFLTFVIANVVNKKAILFLVPFAYYYLVGVVFGFFNIENYSIQGLIAYFASGSSSLPNILFPIMMILIISMLIYYSQVNKEKVVNE